MRYIYLLIFLTPLLSQEEIAPTLDGEELFDYIQDNYTTSYVQGYDSARDILYGEIDNANGYVYCIYTDFSVQLNGSDPSTHLYENGMNCEHVWPRSMGAEHSPMKSDMHHLRPCKSNINSTRGNKPYNEINDFLTDTWFWLALESSSIPTNNINEYSENVILLENDTINIVEYVEKTINKNKKNYNFWKLINNNE